MNKMNKEASRAWEAFENAREIERAASFGDVEKAQIEEERAWVAWATQIVKIKREEVKKAEKQATAWKEALSHAAEWLAWKKS